MYACISVCCVYRFVYVSMCVCVNKQDHHGIGARHNSQELLLSCFLVGSEDTFKSMFE